MSKVLIAEGLGYNLLSVSQLMAKGIHLEADSTTQEFKLYHGRGGLYIGKAVLKNNVFVLDFVPDLGTADSDAIVNFTDWTHPPDLDPDFSPGGFCFLGLLPSPGPAPSFACPQPVQSQSLLQPVSPLPAPSPYTGPTGGLAERRAPASRPASPARPACTSRRTSRPRPPAVPGTHQMALRPSTASLRVPLPSPPESSLLAFPDPESDSLRAASPTVARFLATVVTDPSLASTTASALVAELVDFAASCRLDYAASLVAESASVCPPSVGGECALSTDVLEDRQEEFQLFRVHGTTSIVVTTGLSGAFVPRRLVRRRRVLVPSSLLVTRSKIRGQTRELAAQELRWLTYLLTDLGEQPRSPPVLYVDNKAMLALYREHRLEHRTKHIALRYFLARELQQRGQLRLAYVASQANTADIFTKALAPCEHQRFCTLLACFALLDWSCDLLFSPTLPMGVFLLVPNSFASSSIPVSSQKALE
ncbi:unnamed protein product [Closterium sp. NIES-53]